MGTEDYTASVGGSLKLKGVKDSKVTKQKGKKKNKKPKEEQNDSAAEGVKTEEQALDRVLASEEEKEKEEDSQIHEDTRDLGKTEAEKRHDERRRKRLDERLKREGIKTHKERVEELNRYLSNLSEHHDMPRIGPG